MARILIVEDETDLLDNLAEILSLEGHEAVKTKNVGGALQIVFSSKIDLVLSDLKMGVAGDEGLILLDRMSKDKKTKDIPFLLVTAIADRKSIIRAMKLGVRDYIIKPYTRLEIIEAIAQCLKIKEKREYVQYLIRVTSPGVTEQAIALKSIHTIGRSVKAETRVIDPKVSRIACTFQRMTHGTAEYYELIDGQFSPQGNSSPSANGVRVNGQRIEKAIAIKSGDFIQLSQETWINYQVITEEAESDEPKTVT